MELYAKIEKGPADPTVGVIAPAWYNNVGRFFGALRKTYGRCLGYHFAVDHEGRSAIAGWRFARKVEGVELVTTVKLLTPCAITDPDAVTLNRMKAPYKPFVLRNSARFVLKSRAA